MTSHNTAEKQERGTSERSEQIFIFTAIYEVMIAGLMHI